MWKNKSTVASHATITATTGSITTIVAAAAAASGTLCANQSQTMLSGLSNAARVARSQASHKISSIKSCITKGA